MGSPIRDIAEFVPAWQEVYMKEYTVQVNWDDESERWGLESEDIPWLLLENGSLDALLEYARFAVTDFLKGSSAKFPVWARHGRPYRTRFQG
jgi:hypothetical protein